MNNLDVIERILWCADCFRTDYAGIESSLVNDDMLRGDSTNSLLLATYRSPHYSHSANYSEYKAHLLRDGVCMDWSVHAQR
jgi:hypothetical protein